MSGAARAVSQRANPLRVYERHAAALQRAAGAFAAALLPTDTARAVAGRRPAALSRPPPGLAAHALAPLAARASRPVLPAARPQDSAGQDGSPADGHRHGADQPAPLGTPRGLYRVDMAALRPLVGDTPHAETLARIACLDMAPRRDVVRHNVAAAVASFARGPRDTGSPEVQAAVLTVRMAALRAHLEGGHKKDVDVWRRIDEMADERRKMLKYLRRTSLARYYACVDRLGLPHDLVEAACTPYPAYWYPRKLKAAAASRNKRN